MSQRFAQSTVLLLILAALLAGCKPIQAQVANGQSQPSLEEIKAQVQALDEATCEHLRAHEVATVEAETSQDFVWITAEGNRQGHAEYVAVVADEKLSLDEPIWGEPEIFA